MSPPFPIALRLALSNIVGGSFTGNLLTAMYAEDFCHCLLLTHCRPVRYTCRCLGAVSVQSIRYFTKADYQLE